jgi:hypothetical protein
VLERNIYMNMRIYEDELGIRQIEIDGEPFPCFTQGDITAKSVMGVRVEMSGLVPTPLYHVVMIPVFVGGTLEVEGDIPSVHRVYEDMQRIEDPELETKEVLPGG